MLTTRLHGESDLGHYVLTSFNSKAEDVSGKLRGPDELVGVTRSIEKLLAITSTSASMKSHDADT